MSELDFSNLVIPCPLKRFALRAAAHCLTCDHYNGLAQATEGDAPIEDHFMVICGKPITRRLQRIEVD